MRALIHIPLAVVAVAAGGWSISRVAGATLATSELMIAGGSCMVIAALAAAPLLLARHAAQPAVVQAALVSTLIHMLGCAGVAGFVYLTKIGVGPSFAYWLFAFYLATLIVLVVAVSRQIKSAPMTGQAQRH